MMIMAMMKPLPLSLAFIASVSVVYILFLNATPYIHKTLLPYKTIPDCLRLKNARHRISKIWVWDGTK